jgi:hypothetical protein
MAIDTRPRDKRGEISQKHGNTLIRTLRKTYGARFAKDCADDDKLGDVLARLDQSSLSKLRRDYNAGMLPIRLKSSPGSPSFASSFSSAR